MGGIEPPIVLPVAALHLAVMPWRIGADYLVPDAMLPQTHLEKGGLIPVGGKAVGKFGAIVRLDALNGARESFHKVFHKQGGGIGAVLLKGFHKAPPGILIYGGILEELFADHPAVDKAGVGIASAHIGNKLDFFQGMLVRMVVWPSGEATQRLDGAVITAFPAVDILPVRLVLDSGFRNPIFVSVFNK